MAAKNDSSLLFDISTLPDDTLVLDAFPELRDNPVFVEHGDGANDAFLRMAIWYADKGSEYRNLPLTDKKEVCMNRAGIADDDPRRAAIVLWNDAGVVAMINQLVRRQSSLKYALWLHGTEAAWQTIERLSVNIEDETPPVIHYFHDEDDDPDMPGKVDAGTKWLGKKIEFYGKAIVKAMLKKKSSGSTEMDEAKVQVAYRTRKENMEAMFSQIPKLEELGIELFAGDEDLYKMAMERSVPKAEAGSVEEAIFKRRSRR